MSEGKRQRGPRRCSPAPPSAEGAAATGAGRDRRIRSARWRWACRPDERYRALLGLGVFAAHRGALPGGGGRCSGVAIGEFPEDGGAARPPGAGAARARRTGGSRWWTLLDLVLRHAPLADQEPADRELRDLLAREPMADPGAGARWPSR